MVPLIVHSMGMIWFRQRDTGEVSLLFGRATVPAPTVANNICHCRCTGGL